MEPNLPDCNTTSKGSGSLFSWGVNYRGHEAHNYLSSNMESKKDRGKWQHVFKEWYLTNHWYNTAINILHASRP
jgi:hypothetical protein